jgi:hypothetical protein
VGGFLVGLDIVEFVLATEKAFDLPLSDDELRDISTVGDLTDLIHQKYLAKHGLNQPLSNEMVFIKIKALLVKMQGLQEHQILRTSRFVQDLNMD